MKKLEKNGDVTKRLALIAILAVLAYAIGGEIGVGVLALFLMLTAA